MNELRNRTAIYCRLSQDDGINGYSSSIQTQRMMLEQYSNEHNLKIVKVYVDDGYSKLRCNKPNLNNCYLIFRIGLRNMAELYFVNI